MGNIGAARKLHFNLLENKFHTPTSFFDTTPLGRIINRFSRDIYVIDEALPSTVLMFLGTLFASFSTIIVIISSTPIFAVVVVPLAFIYIFVQVYRLCRGTPVPLEGKISSTCQIMFFLFPFLFNLPVPEQHAACLLVEQCLFCFFCFCFPSAFGVPVIEC